MKMVGQNDPCLEAEPEQPRETLHFREQEVIGVESLDPGKAFFRHDSEKVDFIGISGFIPPIVDHGFIITLK
jgi:hypothetical protein